MLRTASEMVFTSRLRREVEGASGFLVLCAVSADVSDVSRGSDKSALWPSVRYQVDVLPCSAAFSAAAMGPAVALRQDLVAVAGHDGIFLRHGAELHCTGTRLRVCRRPCIAEAGGESLGGWDGHGEQVARGDRRQGAPAAEHWRCSPLLKSLMPRSLSIGSGPVISSLLSIRFHVPSSMIIHGALQCVEEREMGRGG